MRKLPIIMALSMVGGLAHAKKNCTDQPKDKQIKEEDFKKRLEGEEYKIRKSKQPGNCYEIYSNPVAGSVVKEEVE